MKPSLFAAISACRTAYLPKPEKPKENVIRWLNEGFSLKGER